MKRVQMITAIAFLLIICNFADQPQFQAKAENYESVIELNRRYNKRIFNTEFWKTIEVTDKDDNKTKSFTELSNLQQHVFIIVLANQLLEQSEKLQSIWAKEIDKFNDPEYKSTLTKKQVQSYYNDLLEVRREFVNSYCQFVENVLIILKNDITEPEKKSLQNKALKFKNNLTSKKE